MPTCHPFDGIAECGRDDAQRTVPRRGRATLSSPQANARLTSAPEPASPSPHSVRSKNLGALREKPAFLEAPPSSSLAEHPVSGRNKNEESGSAARADGLGRSFVSKRKNDTGRAKAMKPSRKFMGAVTAILTTLAAGMAAAQPYPTAPVTIVQQFSPGGGSDAVLRPLAPELGTILGQSIIVESKPGANGVIANQYVAQSKPDGYRLLFASAGPTTIAPHLYKLEVDPLTAFVPVALVVTTPSAILVNDGVGVSTLSGLIALAKREPRRITYSTSGVGGAPHLAGEMLSAATGAQFVAVPYKGMGPAATAALSGEVNFTFADIGSAAPLIQTGRVKALAVTGQNRSPILPDVPTVQEAGVPGYRSSTWYGIFAPKGTPDPIVKRLHDAVDQALAGALSKRFEALGMEPAVGVSQQAFAQFVKTEYDRLGEVIVKNNIKIEQ